MNLFIEDYEEHFADGDKYCPGCDEIRTECDKSGQEELCKVCKSRSLLQLDVAVADDLIEIELSDD